MITKRIQQVFCFPNGFHASVAVGSSEKQLTRQSSMCIYFNLLDKVEAAVRRRRRLRLRLRLCPLTWAGGVCCWWLCMLTLACHSHAHFIQIDHEEFRASGYPHPPMPPAPLTHLELDHFPQVMAGKPLTPAEVLVDLTNDLTHRLLHYHSILNRNNFAFSPTALVSVLVALYEGSAGRSANELRNVLQFPNNRDVIRVGYRDIHRRLRVSISRPPHSNSHTHSDSKRNSHASLSTWLSCNPLQCVDKT